MDGLQNKYQKELNGIDFDEHVMFFNSMSPVHMLQADECASMRGTGFCDEAPWECHQAKGECHHVSKNWKNHHG